MQKGLVWRVGIAVCLGISVGCQRQTGLSKADQAAIRQTQENDVKLTNAQDWKGDLALYAEDAILMPPNQAGSPRQGAPSGLDGGLSPHYQSAGAECGNRGGREPGI